MKQSLVLFVLYHSPRFAAGIQSPINFALREGMQLQVRTDMFNSLNHTNLSGLVVEITNARFGQLTSTGGARTVQLNARLTW